MKVKGVGVYSMKKGDSNAWNIFAALGAGGCIYTAVFLEAANAYSVSYKI